MKMKSGGGIKSNKVKQVSAPKREPKPHSANPAAVHRLGNAQGDHATGKSKVNVDHVPLNRGVGYRPVGPTDNVAAVGVGGGRTIYKAGSQSPTPQATPMSSSDPLRDYPCDD
jgi:hypothetical protein